MNAKLRAVADTKGRPIGFFMSAGQIIDYTDAALLLGSQPKAGWLLADNGYDAGWFEDAFKYNWIKLFIAGRSPGRGSSSTTKRRNRIEIMFGRLKDWTSPLGSNQSRRNGSMLRPDTAGAQQSSSPP